MPAKTAKIILLLGGARSGKSTRAQQMASKLGRRVLFCATAEALDADMQKRIKEHRRTRPESWQTLEAAYSPSAALAPVVAGYDAVIVDCITLLVSNLMGKSRVSGKRMQQIDKEINGLINLLQRREATYILVSNEVGMGIVPHFRMGREYRDILGKANQQLAASADEVYLMIAGISTRIK